MPNQWPSGPAADAAPSHGCPPQQRSVQTLAVAERFLVWCLRQWVEGWRAGAPDSLALRDGFEVAYVPDGMAPFDAMMRAVVAGTQRQLDVRCLRCRFVSDDESMFLNLVAAGQRDRDDLLTAAFDEFLAPAAVRVASSAALALGAAMTAADMLLPMTAVPGAARAASVHAANHGLRLVQ
ncbi:hypothetical protein [Reyranella sp. CPCC 100927]|uniref:hypothetical protein n=1 Tax=Reyranella sp. CPCC 100927 TaxID=2599616 RepID=UPI0011B59684|nr:hypothetical protein [Reyranella sp. CPCC 100927]TWS94963.1 hypothetical protein FQU96_40660 [Reyranella sp. CPCC 100927]